MSPYEDHLSKRGSSEERGLTKVEGLKKRGHKGEGVTRWEEGSPLSHAK